MKIKDIIKDQALKIVFNKNVKSLTINGYFNGEFGVYLPMCS